MILCGPDLLRWVDVAGGRERSPQAQHDSQYREGGYLNICMHPLVSGRALRVAMLDRLIAL
jgi:hypothetical protein